MAVCSSNFPSVEYEDIVSGQGILNKDIREKSNIKSGIRFEPDDVLFGKLRPYLKNWILPDFSGVAVGDFWVLHPFETDSRYLYYMIQTPAFQTAANQSTGTKMPRSDWNLVSKAIFFSSKDITEQRKIGATLQSIDNLITLHQRTCNFCLLKHCAYCKINFMLAWEQRKLGELVHFSKGTGYSKADLKEFGTPLILYGRLYTKYQTVITEVDTFADAKPASVYSQGGEVIVPASGETAEDISIASVVEKSGVLLGGDLNIITPPDGIDSAFLAISISNGAPHDDMAKMAQGKSVVHLHNADLEKINLLYPDHTEQTKISGYFKQLDTLITLHQRE